MDGFIMFKNITILISIMPLIFTNIIYYIGKDQNLFLLAISIVL